MRVVVAGATGVIGRSLLPKLRIDGRSVIAVVRSEDRAEQVLADGYDALVVDAADPSALEEAVVAAAPEVIINQLTSLPRSLLNPIAAKRAADQTNALRRNAGAALAAAAKASNARLISQSIAFAQRPGEGIRTEDDPLYLDAPGGHRPVVEAIAALEQVTRSVGGTVLRYGAFYGPGTYFDPEEAYGVMLRRRLLPIIGEGRGVWGLLHIEDAVDATIKAIAGPSSVYNITDDEPVPASELLPWLADTMGTKPPRRMPRAMFSTGPATVLRYLVDEQPRVSNERARNELGWEPKHPSWREPLAQLLQGTS